MYSSNDCVRVPTDFKDSLSIIYSAIDEADFLAIDGEFSGKKNVSRSTYSENRVCVNAVEVCMLLESILCLNKIVDALRFSTSISQPLLICRN